MKHIKIKKSTLILVGFTLYSLAIYAYFLPRTDMSNGRIWLTIGTNAVVIVTLWWLYRRKEKMADERKKDIDSNK